MVLKVLIQHNFVSFNSLIIFFISASNDHCPFPFNATQQQQQINLKVIKFAMLFVVNAPIYPTQQTIITIIASYSTAFKRGKL